MRKSKATPEQIAKAKEKRAKVREIAKRIAAMSETERATLVQNWPTTIEGHALSLKNACLVIMQHPGATVLGGFRQWKTAGRFVASGPGSGLSIWIPLIRKAKDADTGEVTEDGERPGFTLGTVFDISQTEEMTRDDASGVPIYTPTDNETCGGCGAHFDTEPHLAGCANGYTEAKALETREPAFALANSEPF